jgi:hypothetical protein
MNPGMNLKLFPSLLQKPGRFLTLWPFGKMKGFIGEGGIGELGWLSFILALRGAYGPNPLFEVLHIHRRKIHKLEVDIKLVSAPLRTFVVGNDIGLDLPSRPAAGGGYLDHQNRFPRRVVVQKEMITPDEELVGLQTGPFDGNRGKATFDPFGAGPMANRVPNVKVHFGINRIPGITPALLVEDLFQSLHRFPFDRRISPAGSKSPCGLSTPSIEYPAI